MARLTAAQKRAAAQAAETENRQVITPIDLEGAYSAEPLTSAMASVFAEMGVTPDAIDSYVMVHKLLPPDSKETRVWRGAVEEYNLDNIAKRFGSGDYTVRVYMQNLDGLFVCRGNKTLSVTLDPMDEMKLEQLRHPLAVAAAPQQDIGATIAAAISNSQKEMMAMLMPLLAGTKQNAIADLKGMAEAFGMMAPARAAAAPATDPMAMFGMFKQFMELTNGMKPEAPLREEEIGPNALMMKGLELFMETMKNAKTAQAAPAQIAAPDQAQAMPYVAPPPMATPAADAPPMAGNIEQSETGADEMKLAFMLLLRAASVNDDVQKWAIRVYEDAPDEVIEALELPDWFAKLCIAEPLFGQHQAWVTSVRDKVLAMLAQDDAELSGNLTDQGNAGTVAG